MNKEKIIDHIRNRPYMSGVDRTEQRKKALQEIFTTDKILKDFDRLDPRYFADPEQPFVDTCCGDGNLLGEALIRKIENGIDFELALSKIYGCDIEQSNVDACRDRLLCGREDLRHIVNNNIVCFDSLKYHHRYDGSDPRPPIDFLFEIE
jgi:hypothetical protein